MGIIYCVYGYGVIWKMRMFSMAGKEVGANRGDKWRPLNAEKEHFDIIPPISDRMIRPSYLFWRFGALETGIRRAEKSGSFLFREEAHTKQSDFWFNLLLYRYIA